MFKNTNNKTKCAKIEYANDYTALSEGLTNPYGYNYGKVIKNKNNIDITKQHHVINNNYLSKK